MDTKEFMVIIKGQIKTSEIMSCVFNKDAQKWEVKFKNGKTYAHILCETFYFSHHCVESDEKGYCVPGGDIIFQRNWNEKQIDAILSKRGGKGRESNIS